ncbi:MAG: hypothetical protein ACRCUS_03865, partial [Anaerovoracaceae bacterium]
MKGIQKCNKERNNWISKRKMAIAFFLFLMFIFSIAQSFDNVSAATRAQGTNTIDRGYTVTLEMPVV